MTCGIYRLKFKSNNVYIGQSVDIEKRFDQHLNNLRDRKSAIKLQSCYDVWGNPELEILCECHKDHLDILEAVYINIEPLVILNSVIPVNPFLGMDNSEIFPVIHEMHKGSIELTREMLHWRGVGLKFEDYINTVEAIIRDLREKRHDEEIMSAGREYVESLLREIEAERAERVANFNALIAEREKPWYRKLFS